MTRRRRRGDTEPARISTSVIVPPPRCRGHKATMRSRPDSTIVCDVRQTLLGCEDELCAREKLARSCSDSAACSRVGIEVGRSR